MIQMICCWMSNIGGHALHHYNSADYCAQHHSIPFHLIQYCSTYFYSNQYHYILIYTNPFVLSYIEETEHNQAIHRDYHYQ